MALDRFRTSVARLIMPATPVEATKRTAQQVLWRDGYGWGYGEAPILPDAHATPALFKLSEAVNAATQAFANRISAAELTIYREQADGELEELKTHPALTLLENPNPFLARTSLFWHLVADMLLNGNHYWFLAGPARGAPVELWRCDPRHTRIVRDKQRYIAGYVVDIDGEQVALEANEVIRFPRPNPFDPFYGMSALTAAAMAAQTGHEMAKWNRTMFGRDYGVPAGIVAFEDWVNDTVFETNKAEWLRAHGKGQRRTAFTRGGKLQFVPVGLSQTDMDFLAGSKWQAEQVYRVFGTYHLLPAETSDDRKVNERLFLEEYAWPLLTLMAEIITDQLLTFWGPRQGKGRLVARFEDIRPRERSIDLEEEREESKGLTLNEWRQRRNLEPLDGGNDVLFVHVQSGDKVKFELDAMPAPPPPAPPTAPADEDEQESEAAVPEDAQERAEQRESANDDTGDDIGERFNKAAWHKELAQWERFVVKRWEADDRRPFRPQHLPGFLAGLIQAALDEAATVEAVKAVFAGAHELTEGQLAVKASYGVPDGTVVLYLDDVESVLVIQQSIQRSVPSDAPIRWTPREQLHITALHSPLVDEAPFRDAFQEAAYPGFAVTASRWTLFETDGDAVPIVLLVDEHEALRAWQAEVFLSFAVRGIPVSPYSTPDAWRPHITLGYVQASYVEASGLWVDGTATAHAYAATMAFTRGDYQDVFVRAAHPVLAAPKEEPVRYEPGKAIQATRLAFESDFEDVLAAARAGDLDRRRWSGRVRTLLRKYGTTAYVDGLIDGGLADADAGSLDDTDQAELNRLLADQGQYVTALGAVLFKADGVSDAQADLKPGMWFNKSIMPAYEAGRLSADKNGYYEWLLGATEEHCETCVAAAGQIHRLRDWHRSGVIPQADLLACHGYFCDCKLQRRDNARARGQLRAIPRG